MTQGYAGQPPSNLMQMSEEPLKKDVVDMKTRQKIGETGIPQLKEDQETLIPKTPDEDAYRASLGRQQKYDNEKTNRILNMKGSLSRPDLLHLKLMTNEAEKHLSDENMSDIQRGLS